MNLFFKKLVVPNEIIYQILLVLEEEKKVLTNLRLANKSFFYTISTHFLFNKFKPKCIQSLQNFTKTLAEFKHLSTLVKEVSFSELTPRWTEVTNSHVIELAKVLPELISLDLEMCERINDSAVQYIIENCKMLEELTLNDCIGLSAYCLNNLGKLKHLELGGFYFGNQFLRWKGIKFNNITSLNLSDTDVTDEFILNLIESNFDTLKFLNLSNCYLDFEMLHSQKPETLTIIGQAPQHDSEVDSAASYDNVL